jgi:hypothetical protein
MALPAPSATNSELQHLLRDAPVPQPQSARLNNLLRWADRVRFGDMGSTSEERIAALQTIADFAYSCEESLSVES